MKTSDTENGASSKLEQPQDSFSYDNCLAGQCNSLKDQSQIAVTKSTAEWLPVLKILDSENDAPVSKPEFPLSPREKQLVGYLQDTLINLLPMVFDKKEGLSSKDRKQLEELRNGLKEESGMPYGERRFGEKTKQAYQAYVAWLEQTALPSTIAELKSLGVQPAPNRPGSINESSDGKTTVIALGLKTNDIPSIEDLKTLNAAFDWLKDSQKRIDNERKTKLTILLKEEIAKEGCPKEWLIDADSDPRWIEKASKHLLIAKSVRDAVQAQIEFGKAARYNDFPKQLPPGAELIVGTDGKVQLKLDLPKTLDEDDISNIQKFKKNSDWLEEVTPRLKQIADELKKPPLFWGDVEIHGLFARLNSKGQLIDFVDPAKYEKKPDERLVKANLVSYRFDITYNEKTGKKEIISTVQAQYASGYLNTFADNIGLPITDKREYGDENWTVIQTGNTRQLLQESDLDSYKTERKWDQTSEKIAIVVGDVAMTATGTIELALVLKAAMIAARTTELAALASRRIILPALNGASDMVLGGSGFLLNNAATRETSVGAALEQARNYAFMGKAGYGLLKAGLAGTRFGGTSTIEELLAKGASEGGFQKTLPLIYSNANRSGELIGYLSLIPIHEAIGDQLRDHSQHRFDVENGGKLVEDILSRPAPFENGQQNPFEVSAELIEEFGKRLGEGRPKTIRDQIEQIMLGARDVLTPDSTPQQKRLYTQRLAELLTFSKEEIKQLEIAQVAPLNANDLSKLMDPYKRQSEQFKPATRALAAKLLAQRDSDVRRAAELALLLVSTSDTADNTKAIASTNVVIPASVDYGPFISRSGKKVATPVQFDEHEIEQTLTRDDLRNSLYRQFEDPLDKGRRLVLAHAMLATAIMKPSHYQAVLKNLR